MKKMLAAVLVLAVLGGMLCVAGRSVQKALYPQKYSDIVQTYSRRYGVDAALLYAVIRTESSFDPEASSDVGARGLMQIMPDTLDWLCYRMGEETSFESLSDPETSIRYGAFFLHLLLEEFGSENAALAAYHAGRGSVSRWLQDKAYSADGKTLDTIPYPDTAHYVSKVENAKAVYEKLYAEKKERAIP